MNLQELSRIARRYYFDDIFKYNDENQLTLLIDLTINDVEYKIGDILTDDELHFLNSPEDYEYSIASIKIGRILINTVPSTSNM